MNDWILSRVIIQFFFLIPTVVGLYYWRLYTKPIKVIVVYILYSFVSQIIGSLLAYYYHNNMIVIHVNYFVQTALLSIYFSNYLTSRYAKKTLLIYPVVYIILFAILDGTVFGFFEHNPYERASFVLFVIALSSIALSHIVTNQTNIIKQGSFWIIAGLLCYYLLNTGYLIMSYWLIEFKSELTMKLYTLLKYSNNILNLLYTLGLWLIAKERKGLVTVKEIN
jgi:hypothetical protein